ncbi:MAG: F0F1 ATP synthase subunit B [Clostridia bacterium]|nr:F0F1 ATP synthase subunit B [Clostridia bacterium]
MQTLDVISVNIWQILISLLNLYILYLIVKRFLFKPVKAVLEERRRELDSQYDAAEEERRIALASRREWEAKMQAADAEAGAILQSAAERAKHRGDALMAEAKLRADSIVRLAENEADLERKKAVEGVKREIIEVSGALTEKILGREINAEDHRNLIQSFIEKMGDGNE